MELGLIGLGARDEALRLESRFRDSSLGIKAEMAIPQPTLCDLRRLLGQDYHSRLFRSQEP